MQEVMNGIAWLQPKERDLIYVGGGYGFPGRTAEAIDLNDHLGSTVNA